LLLPLLPLLLLRMLPWSSPLPLARTPAVTDASVWKVTSGSAAAFGGGRLQEYLGRKGVRGVEHTYPQRARLLDSDYVLVSTLNGSGMGCADSMRAAAAGRIVANDNLISGPSAKLAYCCLANGPTDLLYPHVMLKHKQVAIAPANPHLRCEGAVSAPLV
jgi:hypothetical protein